MSEVYGHDYEIYIVQPYVVEEHRRGNLTLFNPSGENVVIDTTGGDSEGRGKSLIVPRGYTRYRTTYNNSLLIKPPIQMTSQVTYSMMQNDNSSEGRQTCVVSLYNLSDNTLSKIKAGYTLIFNAGYKTQEELPIAFCGDIISVITNKEEKDRVTNIIIEEGKYAQENITGKFIFDRDISGVLNYVDMINIVAEHIRQYGITVEVNSDNMNYPDYNVPVDDRSVVRKSIGVERGWDERRVTSKEPHSSWKSPLKGLVFNGNVFTTLTTLCNEVDHIWFFSKGVLYIQHKSLTTLHDAYLITPDVVIGNITYFDETAGQTTQSERMESVEGNSGISFSTFFDAKIALENNIRVSYGAYAGDYVVTELSHNLNWQGTPWQSTVKCKQVSQFSLNQTR